MPRSRDTLKRKIHPDVSSLGSLSRCFIEFVNSTEDGVVDLNETARKLNARKRRVYDVTNVLEGVQLLEKISKNKVKWTPPQLPSASLQQKQQLQTEISELNTSIDDVTTEIQSVLADVRSYLRSERGTRYLFLRMKDIVDLPQMKRRRCFAISTPQQVRHTITDDNSFVVESTAGSIKIVDMQSSSEKMKVLKDDTVFCSGQPSADS